MTNSEYNSRVNELVDILLQAREKASALAESDLVGASLYDSYVSIDYLLVDALREAMGNHI